MDAHSYCQPICMALFYVLLLPMPCPAYEPCRLKDLVLKWMPVSHNKAIGEEAPEQGAPELLICLVCMCAAVSVHVRSSQCAAGAAAGCGMCCGGLRLRLLLQQHHRAPSRCWPTGASAGFPRYPRLAAGASPIKTVLRSKGFMWIANSHTTAFYWSHAGQHFEIRDEGEW